MRRQAPFRDDWHVGANGPTEDESEECAFCGERRAPDQFEDGLRCKLCVEEDEEE